MARSSTAKSGETGNQETREYFNPWRIVCDRLPEMISRAQDVRIEALDQSPNPRHRANHRGFYVGVSALAVDESGPSDELETAINTMPTKGGSRVCAEERVVARIEKINRARERAFWIAGLVVVGEPQPDGATGYISETLWPCGVTCWPNIVTTRLPEDALIVTVRPDKRKGQVQTAKELDVFYDAVMKGKNPSEPPLFHHAPDGWTEALDRYDALIPRDMDVLANAELRQRAVDAAKVAIQGISLRLV